LGRFIGRDPISYRGGLNLYAAPFIPNKTDPLGLSECEITKGSSEFADTGMLHRTWGNFPIPWVIDAGYASANYAINLTGTTVTLEVHAFAKVSDAGWFSTDNYISGAQSRGGATCKYEGPKKCVWRTDSLPQPDFDPTEQTEARATATLSGSGTDTLTVTVEALAIARKPAAGPVTAGAGVDVKGLGLSIDIGGLIPSDPSVLYAWKAKNFEYICKCKKGY
jgi:uncharacterized protein RhaS with RHS repeats